MYGFTSSFAKAFSISVSATLPNGQHMLGTSQEHSKHTRKSLHLDCWCIEDEMLRRREKQQTTCVACARHMPSTTSPPTLGASCLHCVIGCCLAYAQHVPKFCRLGTHFDLMSRSVRLKIYMVLGGGLCLPMRLETSSSTPHIWYS